jgi:hypothetical protein
MTMAKFASGEWVQKKDKKHRLLRGIVRGAQERSALVCWLGCRKATSHGTKSLKHCDPPRALVLEGSLDANLESVRSGEGLLRTWLKANEVQVAYKNVHTLDDIRVLAKAIGNNKPPFVHISCHGDHDDQDRAFIQFAPRPNKKDRILLSDSKTQEVFRDAFVRMPVLFSACLLGKFQEEMEGFREGAKLGPVAGFSREVYDAEAMLFELLLYHGVLVKGWNFKTAVTKACASLKSLGLRGGKGRGQTLVRVF